MISSPTGDLISVRAFGQLSIVVNTSKASKELLGRRSANYSDKPRLAMLELCVLLFILFRKTVAITRPLDRTQDRVGLEHGLYPLRRTLARAPQAATSLAKCERRR
jgi:hypothetical protein